MGERINEFQKTCLRAEGVISTRETHCKDFCNGDSNGQSHVHAEREKRWMSKRKWYGVMAPGIVDGSRKVRMRETNPKKKKQFMLCTL